MYIVSIHACTPPSGDRDKTPINSTSDPLDFTTAAPNLTDELSVPVWAIVLLAIAPFFFFVLVTVIGITSKLIYRKRKRRRVALLM